MRITLVHPAGFNFVPGQPDFSVLTNRMPLVGILSLASWLEAIRQNLPLHPRQPQNLVPLLGEELYADKVSTVKVSVSISVQKKAANVPLQSTEMSED